MTLPRRHGRRFNPNEYEQTIPMSFVNSDTATVSNTTSETDFSETLDLDDGVLNTLGTVIEIYVALQADINFATTPGLTTRLYIGSNEVLDAAATTISSNNTPIYASIIGIVQKTGSSGTLMVSNSASAYGAATVKNVYEGPNTLDLTPALTVKCSAQWDAAHASNVATLENFLVRIYPATPF